MKSVDTSYILLNNHYIAKIDDYYYLIDTGSPLSRSYNPKVTSVEINGDVYPLLDESEDCDMSLVEFVVGMPIDGIIGMDIIEDTSLTIYQNGLICFASMGIAGKKVKISYNNSPIMIKGRTNDVSGNIIIDTGARYGYGVKELFGGLIPFERAMDYNPILKTLHSDNYHLSVAIDGLPEVPANVCKNTRVEDWCLKPYGAYMIINLLTLYDAAVELNMKTKELIVY